MAKSVVHLSDSYGIEVPDKFTDDRSLNAIVDILEMNLFDMGVYVDIVQADRKSSLHSAGVGYDFSEYWIHVKVYNKMQGAAFESAFADAWIATRDDFMQMYGMAENGYISGNKDNLHSTGP